MVDWSNVAVGFICFSKTSVLVSRRLPVYVISVASFVMVKNSKNTNATSVAQCFPGVNVLTVV